MERSTIPTIFAMLVANYQEMKKVLASLENIILSHEVEDEEEKENKERIAKEVWERDYIIYRRRNEQALAILVQYTNEQQKTSKYGVEA